MYRAGNGEELIPIDMDPAVARRCRATGMSGLGQTLKSFRDRDFDFSVCNPDGPAAPYLQNPKPLVKPSRHPHSGPPATRRPRGTAETNSAG